MFRILVIGLSIILSSSVLGQDNAQKMVEYSPNFKFDDGFYLSFSMVKNNNPIPSARVITNIDRSSNDFYGKLFESKSFAFFDGNGVKQVVSIDKVWGFSRNGVLYIRMSQGFNRITIVGGICHFVATIVTYDTRYNDPYNRNSYSSRYYNPYGTTQSRTTKNQEMKQYILNFENGKTYEYEVGNLEVLLMQDPELYDEYMVLKKKKKKQLKFYYIRKFNERNPIFFPVKNKF